MTGAASIIDIAAGADEDAGRLDRWLALRLPELSRSRIKALIEAGAVTSGGRTIGDASERVKPGTAYRLALPEPEPAGPLPQDIALVVVHEDAHLIVIDKPAGLVVHPAPGNADGTLVNALIAHCGDSLSGIGGVRRPGIVHRLDKDTSGLLVVAKTDAAHRGLSEQFAAHGEDGRLLRSYRALVWGVPDRPAGRIEAALARSTTNRTKIAVVAESSGRHAVTHYAVDETFAAPDGSPVASLMRLELETGRTHQIRVHLAHIRHPVLGDATYGAGFKASARRLGPEAQAALLALGRQALHAAELGFEHPVTGEDMHFESALPDDMDHLRRALAAVERT
ncbi:MAG: RluA family pseudouridine synthase [Hyphomicrobiaceae bacterium]|nr:RluA family pseudouridine synthase [Hyphomicrobiaceae bacterium]